MEKVLRLSSLIHHRESFRRSSPPCICTGSEDLSRRTCRTPTDQSATGRIDDDDKMYAGRHARSELALSPTPCKDENEGGEPLDETTLCMARTLPAGGENR